MSSSVLKRGMIGSLLTLGLLACGAPLQADEAHKDHGHAHAKVSAEVGKPAPEFHLADVEGKQHDLKDYKGKVVVLEWTNHTCPFVVRHQKTQQTMQKTYAKFKGDTVVWLAIDSTNPNFSGGYTVEGIKAWASEKDVMLPYPVLRDADGAVGRMYGAKTTPHMFVIDKNGVLAYAGAIDNDPSGNGNPDARINYVEKALDSLMKGSTVEMASTKPYGCGVKYAKGKAWGKKHKHSTDGDE